MGTIFGNFLRIIVRLWKKLTSKMKDSIIIAVTIVDAIKSIVENPVTGSVIEAILDFVKNAIPGKVDDKVIDYLFVKLREVLPKLLLNLTIINEINQITDPTEKAAKLEEALKTAIAQIKFNTDDQKHIFWRGLSDKFAEAISDGKITWKELGGLTEYVFTNKNELL